MAPNDRDPVTAPVTSADEASTTAQALAAAGDLESAQDVGALDAAQSRASQKLGMVRRGLVERLVYGPAPAVAELQSGARMARELTAVGQPILDAAFGCMARGEAFETDGKLSQALRDAVARENAYGFTVPTEFGGAAATYPDLAITEEGLAANGLGALAVELSGELTIGAGSLLGYGTDEQKRTFLPMIAEGRLMAFGLTEVRIGVNAKKVRAYVEPADDGSFRLHAAGDRNKLWITNATHGALVGLVARLGRDGERVGLFVTELPSADVSESDGLGYTFSCEPSGVDAFCANFNSRIHFENYPIPKANQIQADGVEVLFYCLRMGRCMLAAMSAGYQRMLAHDASHYAIRRLGVGGPVIKHELPRLAIGKMLGGALQSRALSHLSLQQDQDGVDLAGLRDLTKSAAACTAMESMIACERVLGGRSFHKGSRVSDARSNLHVFGVVEGEDDLILMGMVKDVTGGFVDKYMADMLGVIQSINVNSGGEPVAEEDRILKIGPKTMFKHPWRCLIATMRLASKPGFWRLGGWIAGNFLLEVLRLPGRLIPTSCLPRYSGLPKGLGHAARYAERKLRGCRWTYLGISLFFQLELTRAQIPLQRLGKSIEHLVSMLVLSHHASVNDTSEQAVARLQVQLIKDKFRGIKILSSVSEMQRTREMVADVGRSVESGECSLLDDIEPADHAHPWDDE
ncbi:MAG: acyl-CoA dehydrogenase family protein [Planctomycetota bacterium]|nr:acyl-CoA dehydrogenase family protein [Planctomycetota bacterium]